MPFGVDLQEENFIDSIYEYRTKTTVSDEMDPMSLRSAIRKEFFSRADKDANMLSSVEDQCGWLRDIGFVHVDCYMKHFELAVFGGVKLK